MLSILLSGSLCADYVGVDIGSQFFKLSRSQPDGTVRIVPNPIRNSVGIASAAAVKFRSPHSLPLSRRDYEDIEVRFEDSALSLLKRNATLGAEFPPRTLGRNRSSTFHTSTTAGELPLFALSLRNALRHVAPFSRLCASVPSFWTRQQLFALSQSCSALQMSLTAIVSDAQAVLTLYAVTWLPRFRLSPRRVMFVDVGATSAKVYSGQFSYDNSVPTRDFVRVEQLSSSWSERTGSLHFAEAIAAATNISMSKARKLLSRGGGDAYRAVVAREVLDLEVLVRGAVGEGVDEIQLIGGASALRFVADAVSRAGNVTARRDLPANEAVAVGAVIVAMLEEGASPYIDVQFAPVPSLTLNVTCGDAVAQYCKRGKFCERNITLEMDERCEELLLVGDIDELPIGVSRVVGAYRIPAFELAGSKWKASVVLGPPDAVIESVEWCNEKNQCVSKKPEEVLAETPDAFEFALNYLGAQGNRDTRKAITALVERLNAVRAKMDQANVDAPYPMTGEMKQTLGEITEMSEKTGFDHLDAKGLTEVRAKLEQIAKKLRFKL
jgi:hypothetical protein